MIELVPMTESDFARYSDDAMPTYAHEQVDAGNWPADEAESLAQAQYEQILPQGLHTPDQYLWMIHDDEQGDVGYLWLAVRTEGQRKLGFVYDVEIYPHYRRRGYARRAFELMEERARDLGLAGIGLHVFARNDAARALYLGLGYVERGILMSKPIDR